MVKPDEAEKLAVTAALEYMTICGCENGIDQARALMKLASVAGFLIVSATGHTDAVSRMQSAAQFVKEKFQPDEPMQH